MSELVQLLQIREAKRARKRSKMDRARRIRDDAYTRALAAKQAIDDYAEEIRDLEITLLRELMGAEMSPRGIDAFYEKLNKAKKHAEALSDELRQAREQYEHEEHLFREAAAVYQVAEKAKARLGELISENAREASSAEALKLDLELDEFVPRSDLG